MMQRDVKFSVKSWFVNFTSNVA